MVSSNKGRITFNTLAQTENRMANRGSAWWEGRCSARGRIQDLARGESSARSGSETEARTLYCEAAKSHRHALLNYITLNCRSKRAAIAKFNSRQI